MYAERIKRFTRSLADMEIDAGLICSDTNMLYLSGYAGISLERLIALITFSHNERTYLITPKLERKRAEENCRLESVEIISYDDSEDPAKLLATLISKNGATRIGIEETIQYKYVNALSKHEPKIVFKPITEVLYSMRIVKSQAEIDILEKAAEINIQVLIEAIHSVKRGLSERRLMRQIEDTAFDLGADEVPFALVQSGRNSALPHQEPTDKVIEDGDIVVLDIGVRYGGYYSDLTRTVACGSPSPLQTHIHSVVLEAQQKALNTIKSGVRAELIDAAAREVIAEAGFGEYFIHRTGHGLGLEVHEPPYIRAGNAEAVREGMVFTVEPGIYLPEKFGVRIEDNIVVTQGGYINLAPLPKSLNMEDY